MRSYQNADARGAAGRAVFLVACTMAACGRRDPKDEPPAPLAPPLAGTSEPNPYPTSSSVSGNALRSAPAGKLEGDTRSTATPDREPIDALLTAAAGIDARSPTALELFRALGFAGKELQGSPSRPVGGHEAGRTIREALRTTHPLDEDPELESLVQIRVASAPGPTSTIVELYLAWLDRHAHGDPLVPIGRRRWVLRTCAQEGSFTVKTEKVHAADFEDTVVEWEAITTCDGHAGVTGTSVWSLDGEGAHATEVFSFEKGFVYAPRSGKVLDPKAMVRFAGNAPRKIAIVEDDKVKRELTWDETSHRYK